MRLLNTTTLKLEYFGDDPPPYAILSHRWGIEEVILQELENSSAVKKAGHVKVVKTCALAESHGLSRNTVRSTAAFQYCNLLIPFPPGISRRCYKWQSATCHESNCKFASIMETPATRITRC